MTLMILMKIKRKNIFYLNQHIYIDFQLEISP